MNYLDLRQKYPKFIYEKYSFNLVGKDLHLKYHFSISSKDKFTHQIIFENIPPGTDIAKFTNFFFHIGLAIMPSYWKATCSPQIEILAGNLSPQQLPFWQKLFIKGMGEYFYTNQIDFTAADFLKIVNGEQMEASQTSRAAGSRQRPGSEHVAVEMPNPRSQRVLVPIGGGKDSIVTLELLKPHFQVIPFVVNPVPIMSEVIKASGLQNPIIVKSEIDPYLLELNKQGYLNGHTPVSAFYAFCACLACYLHGIPHIAFSNERSSNEGNTTYLGHEINHQYSKTLEFETDFNNLITQSLNLPISYFSFLRPLYELQIIKLFCQYPKYFLIFSSCNQNFKLTHHQSLINRPWCQHCPKCVSTALMLACFIGKKKVSEIMGVYPPDLPINQSLIYQLTGKSAIKPFECVLTRAEARAAFDAVEFGKSDQLEQLLSSWMDNPNMPKEFENILKEAVHKS